MLDTDSGIIGTKEFVSENYQRFKNIFSSKHEKKNPKRSNASMGCIILSDCRKSSEIRIRKAEAGRLGCLEVLKQRINK